MSYSKLIIKKLKTISRFKNLKFKLIGSGSFGDAFSLSNGKVLKITSSSTELKVAKSIYKKQQKHTMHHIYKINDVKLFEKQFRIKGSSIKYKGYILTPKYKKLTYNHKLNNILYKYNLFANIKFKNASAEDKKFLKKYQIDKILAEGKKFNIKLTDLHIFNILKNKNKYVTIDVGYDESKV